MEPKLKIGMAMAVIAALLIFAGCTQPQPMATGSVGATNPQYTYTMVLSNNTTGNGTVLGASLKEHALSANFSGNWTGRVANISLQGSLDNATWQELTSNNGGNTSAINWTNSKPVLYVRIVVKAWNASTNASLANLTVMYNGQD
jgi:hypothetical protein